jgi:hypothetical protein
MISTTAGLTVDAEAPGSRAAAGRHAAIAAATLEAGVAATVTWRGSWLSDH